MAGATPVQGGRRSVAKAGLTLALALGAVAVAVTGAVFSDTGSIAGNGFSTGDVEIGTDPTSALVSFSSDMAPGDADVGTVTVTNAGSLQLRYAITSTTTENVLAGQLDLTVWGEDAEADGDADCATTAPGTVLYGPADLGATTGSPLVGSAVAGSQAGDRTLAAADDEVLCFRVALPVGTTSEYENLDTTATFAFVAEQTANNS